MMKNNIQVEHVTELYKHIVQSDLNMLNLGKHITRHHITAQTQGLLYICEFTCLQKRTAAHSAFPRANLDSLLHL